MTTLPKILVVDDDADTRNLLVCALERQNFGVITAATGFEGLSTVMCETVDVVLLDALLPDIDGFECCRVMHRRLQQDCPPVLIVTGLSDESSVNKAFGAKATDFITKPVNLSVLCHRIKRVLRERQLFHELADTNVRLQQISHTDDLTSLANRRFFQTMLNQEWRRLTREQVPLGLLLCDLDFFKQFNDTYGHLEGDLCLQTFAEILQSCTERPADLVARYGGEEFVLLLPNISMDGLAAIDRKIRSRLRACAIPHRNSAVDEIVTYSAGGVTLLPTATTRSDSLVDLADKALYRAKGTGRNRLVRVAHQLNLT